MIKDPEFRIHEAKKAIAEGHKTHVDPRVTQLIMVLQKSSKNETLVYAYDKYRDDFSRIILNSLFLADTLFDEIRRVTGVPLTVLQDYQTHLFDTTIFRDHLEKLSYVNSRESHGSALEVQYLRAAMSVGSDYIVWLLNGKPKNPPRDIQQHVMLEGMYRSAASRGTSLNSEAAKNAQKWLQMSQRAASDLMRLDPKDDRNALQELKIALEYKDQTVREGQEGIPAAIDILH